MYSSFNGLKIKGLNKCWYYGVLPKNNDVCPVFSEADISLLDEAVPNTAAKKGDVSILQSPKANCFAVAEEIINNYIERDESLFCP